MKTLTKASTNFSPSTSLQTTLTFTPPSSQSSHSDEEDQEVQIVDEGYNSSPLSLTPTPSSGFDPQFSGSVTSKQPPKPKTVLSYLNKFKFGSGRTTGTSIDRNPQMTLSFKRPNSNVRPSGLLRKPNAKRKLMFSMLCLMLEGIYS